MSLRKCILFFSFYLLLCEGYGNNIRLGEVTYRTSELSGSNLTTLTLSFTVSWDNSWCDPYNRDAAYIFLKYRLKTDATATWHPLYIDACNTSAVGYACSLAPGAPGDRGIGLFVERTADDHGPVSVPVTLKWNITSNSRAVPTFSNIKGYEVQVQAFGIEMVRVPRGPFRAGDNHSVNGFWRDYTPFPASEDLINSSSSLEETSSGDPYQAADHVGGSVGDTTSCWIPGSYDTEPYWAVDFGTSGKCIRYIGICAARNSGVPGRWQLRGKNRMSDKGTVLFEKTSADWIFAQNTAYPLEQTIPVANDKTYRYYLLEFFDISGTLAVKSIAMTDADMPLVRDHTVLVDAAELVLDNKCHFAAQDGTPWTSGSVGSDYPNGYPEFYAMKYELSQEQYVSFLNTLSLAQQQALLPGLSKLSEGDYVFGSPANQANPDNPNNPNSRKTPANRNGIIVERKRAGEPVFFANNLNPDNLPGRGDDGQTLACNYLSLQDLLAYAAWSGLRPLTELEYEKLCRPLYVYEDVPVAGEYAWNTANISPAGAVTQSGTAAETASGNVNHGTVSGPLRCGIFAGNRPTTREGSGAGYWGCFELSGNLAEPFYNVNAAGRLFRGKDFTTGHGTGYLTAAALPESGIASSWPVGMDAFALRGGSFSSVSADELAVSDRRYFRNYFSSLSVRDSSVGIRLGRTCPVDAGAVVQNTLTLQNGLVGTGNVVACDTLGDGEDYVITGSGATEVGPVYSVLWYKSEDLGTEWALMEGNTDKDLHLTKMTGRFAQGTKMREYRYRRRIITPTGESTSAATLYVADPGYSINRYRETLVYGTTSHGITISSTNAGLKVKWVDIKTGTELPVTAETATSSYYRADCHDFPNFVPGEERKIETQIAIHGHIQIKDTVTYLMPAVSYAFDKRSVVIGSGQAGVVLTSNHLVNVDWTDVKSGKVLLSTKNALTSACRPLWGEFPDQVMDEERIIRVHISSVAGCYEWTDSVVMILPHCMRENPFVSEPSIVFANTTGSINTLTVKCDWDPGIPRKWSLVGAAGGITINPATGVLSGLSGTMCNITVALADERCPEDTFTKKIKETYRDFSYTNTKKTLILTPGSYNLECWGASGGANSSSLSLKGAYARSPYTTSSVQTVTLLAGQQGGWGSSAGGGGGGSFIVGAGNTPLCIAGGGGGNQAGNAINSTTYYYAYGQATQQGGRHPACGANTVSYGGLANTTSGASGGGGLNGNGGQGTYGLGGIAFVNGGTRVNGTSNASAYGGFGGGGSTHGSSGGGGGGGGYTGGSGGNHGSPFHGGGGGSYFLTGGGAVAGYGSMPAVGGGNETGHYGNGYIRITVNADNSAYTAVGKQVFYCQQTEVQATIPAGTTHVRAYLIGGAGGGGGYSANSYYSGAGGYTTVLFPIGNISRLGVITGQGGRVCNKSGRTTAAYPNGGIGQGGDVCSGSGGGRSQLRDIDRNQIIAIAGGGGGNTGYAGNSGAGGGSVGQDAGGNYSTGGTQSNAGGPRAGGYLQGAHANANTSDDCGGGGDGYYGGGTTTGDGKPGAGGSGYVNYGLCLEGFTYTGNYGSRPSQIPATILGYATGSYGVGVISRANSVTPYLGNDGLVIIEYLKQQP